MRKIFMMISVLLPCCGIDRLAVFRALIVPRFLWPKIDLLGFMALFFNVFWNPRMHS